MLREMKTWKDVFVEFQGRTMRYSDYIELQQNMYDKFNWVTEEMLNRQREEEDRLLAQIC